jgi:hypothetical protein
MSQFLTDTLAKLMDTVSDIKAQVAVSLALHEKNSIDLEKHIKRTDLLEEKVDMLRKHQAWWGTTAKVLAVLIPIVALILKLTGVV